MLKKNIIKSANFLVFLLNCMQKEDVQLDRATIKVQIRAIKAQFYKICKIGLFKGIGYKCKCKSKTLNDVTSLYTIGQPKRIRICEPPIIFKYNKLKLFFF